MLFAPNTLKAAEIVGLHSLVKKSQWSHHLTARISKICTQIAGGYASCVPYIHKLCCKKTCKVKKISWHNSNLLFYGKVDNTSDQQNQFQLSQPTLQ
jgi:hypothetical protein